MTIRFSIKDWIAWAPGLEDRAAWMAWARAPIAPHGDDRPTAAQVPAMLRRRLNRLGRMALECAYAIHPGEPCPVLFCSRHGDTERALALLSDLAACQPLSPGSFGMSVHNAVGAVFSIARGDTANYRAIASGADSVESGVIEACGMLADGTPQVLLVAYDVELPGIYGAFADEPQASWAWAWLLESESGGGGTWSLEPSGPGGGPAGVLPHGLEVLRFILAGEAELAYGSGPWGWCWRRHD